MALGDMFLKIDGARQGPIKGESQDQVHKDEIDVLNWSWGMEGNYLHGQATPKATVHELKITKRVDRATTALMASLRNNELIKKAVLSVRKAGGQDPVEYFKITMENARITSLMTRSGGEGDSPLLTEDVSIAFDRISVEYKSQGADGLYRAASTFEMNVFEGV